MANKEILDALMDIFNSANYRFLNVDEITEQVRRKGFYTHASFSKAYALVLDHLCCDQASATYPFQSDESGTLWGLETWFPPKPARTARKTTRSVSPLPVGWETQHVISIEGQELDQGTFPLRENLGRLVASLGESQRETSLVPIRCYGSEEFRCSFNFHNRSLESKALQHWYNENGVQPGDRIWLAVEATEPLTLRIHTEWDRDADTYRRYTQRRQLESLPRSGLPIRDLIWLHFKQTQKIAHRADIEKAAIDARPEISARSVDGCLHANPNLFASAGERGMWGLKEWGIEQVTMYEPRKEIDRTREVETNRPTSTYPLDYVLTTIHGEDLIYKVLQSAKVPLSYSDLAERIGKYLGVDKSILERTSFLNVKDARLVRLHDGNFQLREDLEEVIRELTIEQNELSQSLSRAAQSHENELDGLKDELADVAVHYQTRINHAQAEIARLEKDKAELAQQFEEYRSEHEKQANPPESQPFSTIQPDAELEQRMSEAMARLAHAEMERDEALRYGLVIYAELMRLKREGGNQQTVESTKDLLAL